MKEFSKGWDWQIIHKFEIDYSDFQPNAGPKKNLSLVWIPRGSILFLAQIKNTIQFAGPGISIAELFLADAEGLSPPQDLDHAFISYDVSLSVGDRKGKYRTIPERKLLINGIPMYQILNHSYANELYLVLRLNKDASINNLTQGKAFVWFQYTYFK